MSNPAYEQVPRLIMPRVFFFLLCLIAMDAIVNTVGFTKWCIDNKAWKSLIAFYLGAITLFILLYSGL